MGRATIEKTIRDQLAQLPVEKQQQVLEFVRALSRDEKVGVPGRRLLRFAGIIDRKDLIAIEKAVNEGCERIDANEW
jgi:hypothetical protein